MPVKGGYLFMAGGGAILVYSGLKNKSLSSTFRHLLSGKSPATAATGTNTVNGVSSSGNGSGGSTNPAVPAASAASIAAYKTYALVMLTSHGWPGQFAQFNNVVMAESGWNNNASNSGSGAYGIAQALGHGDANTTGSHGNNYGGYGTSDTVSRAANNGNGYAQIIWMCNYIAERYVTPADAWAFHQENGYY
jgi:hypothetical protein